VSPDAIKAELLRVLAHRGELTLDLEATDLAIARFRAMYELALQSPRSPPVAEPILCTECFTVHPVGAACALPEEPAEASH
jgi:hypothetical protein